MAETATFVGRERELERFGQLLEAAAAGESRFVEVSGEAGIGKTFLLGEMSRRADDAGWLVLSGRCSELEQERPFGLVIDAFDDYLASLDVHDFERIAPDVQQELAGLFPSLRPLAPESADPDTPAERFRAHHAVKEMIERLATRQPLLLVLDDLHWADPASIEQAGYFLRRPPEAPVIFAGSFRTGQADPAFVAALRAIEAQGGLDAFQLGPLELEQARELLGDDGDTSVAYERSGGNPYYLLQLVRAEEGGTGVPTSVSAAIATELGRLGRPARSLVEAAAVAGDPFELDLAVGIAQIPEAEALAGLDELIARDIVRSTEVPRVFQFRHPLVRSAVYEEAPHSSRLAGHERAAALLAGRGAPATERVHHVENSARHGDMEAVAILREAGMVNQGRAPASAARWFDAALRLMPTDAPARDRVELLLARARVETAVGRFEAARTALIEGIDLAEDAEGFSRLRLISACAAIEQQLGMGEQARRRVTEALERLPDGADADAAALLTDLANDAFYAMDYAGFKERAMKAKEAADRSGDGPLRACTTALLALALAFIPETKAAEEAASAAAELLDGLSDEQLAERLDTCGYLAGAEFYLDRNAEGEKHSRRGLEVARATGLGEFFPMMTQALGNILFVTGQLEESAELLGNAVEAARTSGNPVGLVWSLLNLGVCSLMAGDLDGALEAARESHELASELGATQAGAWAGTCLGTCMLEAGDAAAARELILKSAGGPEMPLIPGAPQAMYLAVLSSCELALGDREAAVTAARRSRQRADICGVFAKAYADRAEAEIALFDGDHETAAALAVRSAEQFDQIHTRIEAGRSRLVAGRSFAAAGDKESAVAQLERGSRVLAESGSRRYHEQCERELRKLGRGASRRLRQGVGASGVESLSEREMEVAKLVVDRRTNPEIAAELFLSVKTVESHMRNIFGKLGVDKRADVARELERAGSG